MDDTQKVSEDVTMDEPEPVIEDAAGAETRAETSPMKLLNMKTFENMDGVRKMGKDAFICRDEEKIKKLYEAQNILRGIKPMDQQ